MHRCRSPRCGLSRFLRRSIENLLKIDLWHPAVSDDERAIRIDIVHAMRRTERHGAPEMSKDASLSTREDRNDCCQTEWSR
jgi:hypothetical protein